MSSFLQAIHDRVLVLDGGMGSMLLDRGLRAKCCPEEMNLSHPDVVSTIHREYLDAGADVLLTNSFGANRMRLAHFQLQDQVKDLNRRALQLARMAAPDHVFVGVSVGPTGLAPGVDATGHRDRLVDAYHEQIESIAAEQPDFVAFETFYDLDELCVAIRTCRDLCDLPIVAQMTFDESGRSALGTRPEAVASRLDELQVNVLGTNCGQGIVGVCKVLAGMRTVSARPLVARANAGLPTIKHGQAAYPETPGDWIVPVQNLLASGVRLVGGCCGTTPDHTRVLRKEIDGFMARSHPCTVVPPVRK